MGMVIGAAVGATLVRLLRATGHDVVSEYYINDTGPADETPGVSVLAGIWSCGQTASFPEDGYQGDYIRAVCRTCEG